ncbi:hypothetical protein CsatA_026868 [Cannabis sativa]
MTFGVIIRVESEALQSIQPEVSLVKLREIKCKIDRKNNVQDRFKNTVSVKDVVRIVEGPCRGKQGPVEHIYKGVLFIYDRHHLEHAGFICAKSQSCVAVVKEIVPLVMAMKINGLVDIHFFFLMNYHSDHADIDLSFDTAN